jgi:hypothetical protein
MADVPKPPVVEPNFAKLFSDLLGAAPPPRKSELFIKGAGKFIGTVVFLFFSVAFLLGLFTIIVLLIQAIGHLL